VKQRITVEQLQELTSEQQERLREWWEPEVGDYIVHDTQGIGCLFGDVDIMDKTHMLPRLSIGQCIELLKDKTNEQSFGYNDSGCFWTVNVGNRGVGNMIEGCAGKQFSTAELIDALWQTVKEVL
jgi:hypothetical protein